MSLVNWAKSQRAVPRGCARGWFEIDIARRREGLSRFDPMAVWSTFASCRFLFLFFVESKAIKKEAVDPKLLIHAWNNIWCVKSDPSWMDECFIFFVDWYRETIIVVDSAAINRVEPMKKYRYLIQILNIIRAVKSDPSWIKLLNISSFVHWYTLAITVLPRWLRK